MRQIYNEIIKRNDFTPEDWKKVTIKVIHKKGDVDNVGNYRPICSLRTLYKLFSTILYGRLFPVLDQKQAEDQAGFRKSYQITDHLTTYRLMEQKCHEWGINLWTATVDFTKAFDSITHTSNWDALKSCNIDHEYISLLKKMYKDQMASVQTDEESNIFEIRKGTKQGDPLSSLLFNTVLQYSLKNEIQRLQKKKGVGIYLSDYDHDCLTDLEMDIGNVGIECPAKPITHAFIHFKNDGERNKFIRSAILLKKEMRVRKDKDNEINGRRRKVPQQKNGVRQIQNPHETQCPTRINNHELDNEIRINQWSDCCEDSTKWKPQNALNTEMLKPKSKNKCKNGRQKPHRNDCEQS